MGSVVYSAPVIVPCASRPGRRVVGGGNLHDRSREADSSGCAIPTGIVAVEERAGEAPLIAKETC
jgi:hypothetical protein